ncbi:MAG: HupE/UreJ family protein [Verrucomicrobiota bacterium]|nr:HupE/UreJ family protein [Verrucomicrobiota bacterium]
MHLPFWLRCVLLFVLLRGPLLAHPIPDVPARAYFEAGGACKIEVEVDPRCFADDPESAPSMLYLALRSKPEAERAALLEQARAFAARTIEFYFDPLGRMLPEFRFEFTGNHAAPLVKDDDVVVLTGTWQSSVPAGIYGYRIRTTREAKLSVLFLNHLQGEAVERTQVLFPGETSFLLDLTGLSATAPTAAAPGAVGVKGGAGGWWRTFGSFFRQGFVHVLPLGLDHILFVLGLFLLRREWKPLLWQITAFTVAHTITLALATLGAVSVPLRIVEPIIAASLFFVAMENIFRPRYTMWRLVVVFVFGLVHGLGFAGALQELELPLGSLVVGLLGFNAGVEGGQIAVVALAFLATAWLRNPVLYRRIIVVPGSAAIALMGVWWTVDRVRGDDPDPGIPPPALPQTLSPGR